MQRFFLLRFLYRDDLQKMFADEFEYDRAKNVPNEVEMTHRNTIGAAWSRFGDPDDTREIRDTRRSRETGTLVLRETR